jgi:16S rRNA (guanine966-N2)-methyltransferase
LLSILSGKYKGHKLICPKSGTRPTSSIVKKALFDILRSELYDVVFCDLFAGSGAIGLEALSQGASRAIFIEPGKQAFSCIRSNVELLKCVDACSFHLKKAHKYLSAYPEEVSTVDIFFVDPPYDIESTDPSSYEELLKFFDEKTIKSSCLIICETKDPKRLQTSLSNKTTLSLESQKSYGDTFLFFIRKSA